METPPPTPTDPTTPSADLDLGGFRTAWEHVLASPETSTSPSPSEATRPMGPTPSAAKAFGRYQVIAELGRGGMGVVYRAWDPALGREVALKRMRGDDPELVARFLREAQTAARVKHPGLVPVHDFGEVDGEPFFTMELIEGRSLADALAARAFEGKPIEGARVVAEVARAVAQLHVEGLVHRDLKPSNVLLDREGRPRITDFGLVRDVSAAPSSERTVSGAVIGTPAYMSPEQARGRAREVTPASDVFSLGVMLYEVLTGMNPFVATGLVEVLKRISEWDPPAPAAPRPVGAIVEKAMAKAPSRRYQTAAGLADDLERFLRGEAILARPPSAAERVWRWARKRRLLVGVAGASLATAAVLAVPLWRSYDRSHALREAMERRAAAQPFLDEGWEGLARWSWDFTHGKPAAAEAELARVLPSAREAVARFPEDARAHALLAGACFRAWSASETDARREDCRREVDRALALDPHEAHALFFEAALLSEPIARRAVPAGWNWSNGAPTLGPEDAEMREGLRRLEEALSAAKAGAPEAGPFERGVFALVEAMVAMWKKDEKATIARLAEIGVPSSARRPADGAPRLLDDVEYQAYLTLVWLDVLQLRDVDRAAAAAEEGLVRWEGDRRLLSALAACRSARGRMAEAEAVLDRLIAVWPRHWESLGHRGSVRHAQGKRKEAEEDYRLALEINPSAPELRARLGKVEFDLGEIDHAIEDWRRAVKQDPHDAQTWGYLGSTLAKRGDAAGAAEAFSGAIMANPKESGYYMARAKAYWAHKDLDWAEADLDACAKLDPTDFAPWYVRGAIREERGHAEGAIADYGEAERLSPKDPDLPLYQARLLRGLGKSAEAHAAAQRAIDRAPAGWEGAKEARAILDGTPGPPPR